ncbi:MAG: site-specific integrase, partial [Candidatus Methanomethylicaceae archaeon]
GGRKLSRITRSDLFEFKKSLKSTPKQRGGKEVTNSTVNRALAGLRRLFNYAVGREFIRESPFPREPKSGLFYSEKVRGKKHYFTETEIRRIIDALPEEPWYLRPMVITAYLTGMRAGELMNLKKKDVNLETGEIILENTKARRPQVVKMQDELVDLFREWLKRSESEYVFSYKDGRPLRHWHYQGYFRKALETIGKRERGWSFHTLRHTTGTHLYLKGAPVIAIRDQLRHSDIRVTTDFYVGSDPQFQKREIEKLTEVLSRNVQATA